MAKMFTDGRTREEFMHNLVAPQSFDSADWKVIAHHLAVSDNKDDWDEFWKVVEITGKTDESRVPIGKTERFIFLDLIKAPNKKEGGGWWLEELTEREFPGYYKCPLHFLDMVPVTNGNPEWRSAVRRFWAGRGFDVAKNPLTAASGYPGLDRLFKEVEAEQKQHNVAQESFAF
jgi:hypothetical protein